MAENSLKVGKINIGTRPIDSPPTPTSETPFCIVVMGDFSGQERPAISDVASKRLHRVDRDNFDEVLAEMKVVVRLPSSQSESQETTIPIRNREDLHPDSLYERLDLFRELRVLRKKLTDAMTFEEGLAEWQSLMGDETNDRPPEEDQVEKPSGAEISDEKLLDQMLQSSQVQSSQEKQDWQYHLKKIAAPYILPNREDEQKEVLPQVDSILSIILRAILHGHPFQEIESAWLSVDFLVHRLESDTIQIFLLDVSKSEMVADFENDDLQACGLYKVLVEQTGGTAGGLPVSLLVGNYVFEQSGDDARI